MTIEKKSPIHTYDWDTASCFACLLCWALNLGLQAVNASLTTHAVPTDNMQDPTDLCLTVRTVPKPEDETPETRPDRIQHHALVHCSSRGVYSYVLSRHLD